VLKEGKSGEYAKKGHGARPFEDYVPIMFPCDGEVRAYDAAATAAQAWSMSNVVAATVF
jgi:hypothetical protein